MPNFGFCRVTTVLGFLLTDAVIIRDVILVPHMRPEHVRRAQA